MGVLYDKEKLGLYLRQRTVEEADDEQGIALAEMKLISIIRKATIDSDLYCDAVRDIEAFTKRDEASKRKLCLYCLDFCDPSVRFVVKEVVQQSFLTENEFEKLQRFVKTHKNDKTFGDAVYEIMYKHKMSAPEVYKNAKLSRQDFSRVTSLTSGGVRKSTVWSIIVGLHCDLDEADYLLYSAGYIRRKTKTDLILEFFITNKNYDILAINDALNDYGQKPLAITSSVKDNDVFDN